MIINFDPHRTQQNKFFAAMSGLCVGMTEHNLVAIDQMAREVLKSGPDYTFPFIVTTWNLDWNDKWTYGLMEKIQSYPNIKLHLFIESYSSPKFQLFISHFCKSIGVENSEGIPSSVFKTLAVFYIKRQCFQNVHFITGKLDPFSIWSGYKFNSNFLLPIQESTTSYSFTKKIFVTSKLNSNLFTKRSQYYMDGPLDCLIVPEATNEGIKENIFYTSLSSARRIFKSSDFQLAEELANFYKKIVKGYKKNNETLSSFNEMTYFPRDFRTEGQFIFKHLVDNAYAQVNWLTNSHLFDNINALLFRSPNMSLEKDSKLKIYDDSDIVNKLIKAENETKKKYILDRDTYSNLNYTSTEEIKQV